MALGPTGRCRTCTPAATAVLGIDPALRRTGWALVIKGAGIAAAGSVPVPKKLTGGRALEFLTDAMGRVCVAAVAIAGSMVQVAIEEPWHAHLGGQRGRQLGTQRYGQLVAGICYGVAAAEVQGPVQLIGADEWKAAMGMRRGTKREVRHATSRQLARMLWPAWKFSNQDEVDAALLAQHHLDQLRLDAAAREGTW